jgi:hypothetical protein
MGISACAGQAVLRAPDATQPHAIVQASHVAISDFAFGVPREQWLVRARS